MDVKINMINRGHVHMVNFENWYNKGRIFQLHNLDNYKLNNRKDGYIKFHFFVKEINSTHLPSLNIFHRTQLYIKLI